MFRQCFLQLYVGAYAGQSTHKCSEARPEVLQGNVSKASRTTEPKHRYIFILNEFLVVVHSDTFNYC